MTVRTWSVLASLPAFVLFPLVARTQVVRSAGLPGIACGEPLPDPVLAAIALQPSDLPDGWRVFSSCILMPAIFGQDGPPHLSQLIGTFGDPLGSTSIEAGSSAQLPRSGGVDVGVYDSPAAAAAAFADHVAAAYQPVVLQAVVVTVNGRPPPPIATSVQGFDLPAPPVGDEAAAWHFEVTETQDRLTTTSPDTRLLFRRGTAVISIDVQGYMHLESIALQLAQTLDAHARAVLPPAAS